MVAGENPPQTKLLFFIAGPHIAIYPIYSHPNYSHRKHHHQRHYVRVYTSYLSQDNVRVNFILPGVKFYAVHDWPNENSFVMNSVCAKEMTNMRLWSSHHCHRSWSVIVETFKKLPVSSSFHRSCCEFSHSRQLLAPNGYWRAANWFHVVKTSKCLSFQISHKIVGRFHETLPHGKVYIF